MANDCVISEVLCFCYNYYGKTPTGEIIDALVGFYEDKEIELAKETLFNVVRGVTPKIDDCRDADYAKTVPVSKRVEFNAPPDTI